MSEFLGMRHGEFRGRLLATASALVLAASISSLSEALAGDTDRPLLWIELGGQLEQFSGPGDPFAPPFVSSYDWHAHGMTSPVAVQTMNMSSFGEEGSISFEPGGSDWVFSVSVRYGRSNGRKHKDEKPPGPRLHGYIPKFGIDEYYTPTEFNFVDTRATRSEDHLILDFRAGKDLGLGMFGHGSTSVANAGVRIAKFHSRATALVNAQDGAFTYNYFSTPPSRHAYFPSAYVPAIRHNNFALSGKTSRSFQGIGPSLAWNASVLFIGDTERGEVTFDWGANAALLFGRQKVSGHHQTTANYHKQVQGPNVYTLLYQTEVLMRRARTVMVPNVGGMAGLSVRYSNAKISLGYRADFFLGAMDNGIDTAHRENAGFYGPFATFSIGLP